MFTKDTLQPTACKGKRFIRRQDLAPYIRLKIAYRALCGAWGEITQLARDFMVSGARPKLLLQFQSVRSSLQFCKNLNRFISQAKFNLKETV